ncbi:MAG: hypothetical protein KBT36_16335 [Kurthia sp.]|nr:hypothetical protein [Candidatus Kurthia equi]
MKLPRGITGFFDEKAALQMIDLKKFRSLCYDVSLHEDIVLISIKEAVYPTNYICAKFSVNDQPIQILLNAYYPLLAAAVITEHEHIVFCELPKTFESFIAHYQSISLEELQEKLREEHLEQLSEVERQQITFWAPQNVGEIIFNTWD